MKRKPLKIAITGKGGVGKTTIAGTLARLLARDGFDVIAIDADPSMNLASSIGIKNPPRPLTEHCDLIEERAGSQGGMFKLNPKVDDIAQRFCATGPDNVKLLVMGTVERGGSGCMCPPSAFLKALVRHMILKEDSAIVLDMEAGIEHLGRGITKGIDHMIIVIEPGRRSIETARQIIRLGKEIDIKNFSLIINKFNGKRDIDIIENNIKDIDARFIGSIPLDENLIRADLEDIAPIDIGGSAVDAIRKIKDNLLKTGDGSE